MTSISGPRPIAQTQLATPSRSFSLEVPLKTIDSRQMERPAGSARVSGHVHGRTLSLDLPFVHRDIPTHVDVQLEPDGSFKFKKKVYDSMSDPVRTYEATALGHVRGNDVRLSFGSTVVTTPRYGAYNTDMRYGTTNGHLDAAAPPAPTSQHQTAATGSGGVDREMWRDLVEAAVSGQGITKGELKKIVEAQVNDGPPGVLSAAERNALKRAVDEGHFARSSTADVAERIANGEGVSLLGLRTVR